MKRSGLSKFLIGLCIGFAIMTIALRLGEYLF